MASVPKSQYDDLQKRHENMRKSREREQRRCSKLEAENEHAAAVEQQLLDAQEELEKLRFGLENCRLLAARHRKEDWALLILGFCAEAGVVGERDAMNRAQARAILDHLDLIRHFAEGGEIGHRLHDHTGAQVAIYPTQKILLSNIETGGLSNYCKVKKRLRYRRERDCWDHAPRYWPERINETEVLK